jgi:hypothetical protein
MLDPDLVEERRVLLCDRFTPEELILLINVTVEQVFDRFFDECLELDMEEI